MPVSDFVKHNKGKLTIYISIVLLLLVIFRLASNHTSKTSAILGVTLLALDLLLFIVPAYSSFAVVDRLIKDKSKYSILSLFDAGYSVELDYKGHWLFFTRPFISATISGLPVKVYYTPGGKTTSPRIHFTFTPLMKAGSKRIYSTGTSFKVRLYSLLTKDVKPDILKCVEEAKAKNYTSGVGRPVAKNHFDLYAE